MTLANWQTAQFLRWSFQHAREIVPTARVSRGTGAIAELPESLRSLADVKVPRLDGVTTTVGAVVGTTYTDGFMVLHDGRVIAEEYPSGMAPDTLHLLMSVTKSLVESVAAVLVDQGALDPAALLTTYVPALAASGYAGATVRHVLDMRSGITFSEDYLNPDAEVRMLAQCIGWSTRRDRSSPASMYDFLLTLKQGSPHGGPFAYRSSETDVLGWVCEEATGRRMPGGMYRNQFWLPYPDRDVLLCLGIHGQMIYVNPAARLVGVKLSSWPSPQDAAMLSATLQAFDAVAGHVGTATAR